MTRLSKILSMLAGWNLDRVLFLSTLLVLFILFAQVIVYYYQLKIVITNDEPVSIETTSDGRFLATIKAEKEIRCYNGSKQIELQISNVTMDAKNMKTFSFRPEVGNNEVSHCIQFDERPIYSFVIDSLLHLKK